MGNLPKTRKEAAELGETYYFTGVPCSNGHIAPRLTQNRNCKKCVEHRNLERTKTGYWKDYGDDKYKEKKREYAKRRYKKNKSLYQAQEKLRRNRLKLCNVSTEEGNKRIKLKYLEAQRLTLETGVEYVVDHIVPLRHPLVSGLHTDANLRVITAAENLAKGNSFSIEDD